MLCPCCYLSGLKVKKRVKTTTTKITTFSHPCTTIQDFVKILMEVCHYLLPTPIYYFILQSLSSRASKTLQHKKVQKCEYIFCTFDGHHTRLTTPPTSNLLPPSRGARPPASSSALAHTLTQSQDEDLTNLPRHRPPIHRQQRLHPHSQSTRTNHPSRPPHPIQLPNPRTSHILHRHRLRHAPLRLLPPRPLRRGLQMPRLSERLRPHRAICDEGLSQWKYFEIFQESGDTHRCLEWVRGEEGAGCGVRAGHD